MDQRVCEVMLKLREQKLPSPSDSQTVTHKIIPQAKQKMSLVELAQEVGLSESRLRALFKANLGLTPSQYIRKVKMDAAADMLGDAHMRVAEIAAKLDFNDNSRFARYFKEAHGMTPTEYRKLHCHQIGGAENISP